jgi:polyribonucleotide nucleotidyltransferase
MKPQGITKTITMGDGRTITIETGVLAKQADGAVTVRLGDTILLATVVSTKEARDGIDFLPLTVEYREKFSAAGRFPGGFFKREARMSDHETLTCRLVDRAHPPAVPR